MEFLRALLVVGIVGALLTGGTLHAAVPHEHGGHTHAEESPQWSALHGAVRHEEKKDLLFFALIALGALLLAPRMIVLISRIEPLPFARVLVPEEVRRGTVAYRRFG